LKGLPGELKSITDIVADLQKQNGILRKQLIERRDNVVNGIRCDGAGRPCVSDECAAFLGAVFLANGLAQRKISRVEDGVLAKAAEALGMENIANVTKAALTTTDIPMPVQYMAQIVELVYTYGNARKEATIFPVGTNSIKMPRLTTDPTFGAIAVSGSVTEKSPQIGNVTFSIGKVGGIVRLPNEILADSIVPLGQFVARYIARQMAYAEDRFLWLGDGTSTYNNITGVGLRADTDTYKVTLATTKTHPSDITLTDLRNLRAQITYSAIQNAKYSMHPSMEALLASYNTSVIRYWDAQAKTLDGFPVVFVPALPVYTTSATINAYQAYFGDMSYWYMAERLGVTVDVSNDRYFDTDEVGIRAIERFDFQQMGAQSTAVLKLAAS
jgi:HK97 family phage major capsid protein